MKEKLSAIGNRFFNVDNLTIRLVLFNIVTLGGIIGGTVGLIFTVALGTDIVQTFTILVSLLVLYTSFYLANYKNRIEWASTSIIGAITLILFPVMFFSGGGVYSGMGYWFALGMLFNFMLVDGVRFYVLVVLQILAILTCYITAYCFPESVTPLKDEAAIIIDILQSIFILAFVIGIIVRFQNKVYENSLEKINRKNEQLKSSEERAEKANKAKSEFLSNMSHEIRTPVNAIVGINQLIMREAEDDKIVGYSVAVENSANWLMSIISDILDISKIEEGRIEIIRAEYEICSFMIDSYNMIKKRARDKNLQVYVHISENIPRSVIGDVMRIRQILVNLMTNAVKYTEEGRVDVEVSGEIYDDLFFMKIIVKDTGMGIEAENLDKLFDKFRRFDIDRNRNVEGTGLGLHITKMLVELMEGRISVKSEYGKGSEFTVIIPHEIADATPIGKFEVSECAEKSGNRKCRRKFIAPDANILVVDDVKINLYVFENLLKETRINIDRALSGSECIRLVKNKCYDMVFMDHMMPEMDGIKTYNTIKNMPDNINADTPFIMLTANTLSGMGRLYISNGFSDYLTKPIDSEKLENTIMKYLPKEKLIMSESEVETSEIKTSEISEQKSCRITELCRLIPEIDTKSGISYCDGSEDFYIELLKDYSSSYDRIAELEKFYAENNRNDYKISVHSLKSISKTLGFNSLSNLAEKMQYALEQRDIDYIHRNHPILIANLKETISKLNEFF